MGRQSTKGGTSMKMFRTIATTALLFVLAVAPGYAQQPATPQDPHHPDASKGTSTGPGPDTPSAGMPMEMCRQMMGHMMAMPMMGGTTSADPKEKADMLQMRGEMMKAMGDIMMKHARRMQGATGK
jgi:hypothetical protein